MCTFGILKLVGKQVWFSGDVGEITCRHDTNPPDPSANARMENMFASPQYETCVDVFVSVVRVASWRALCALQTGPKVFIRRVGPVYPAQELDRKRIRQQVLDKFPFDCVVRVPGKQRNVPWRRKSPQNFAAGIKEVAVGDIGVKSAQFVFSTDSLNVVHTVIGLNLLDHLKVGLEWESLSALIDDISPFYWVFHEISHAVYVGKKSCVTCVFDGL